MRVKEWARINKTSLSAVHATDVAVELIYRSNEGFVETLRTLVESENACCGAAGVEFVLNERQDDIRVVVKVVRNGLPAKTVIAAFAAMTPSK